MTQFLLLVALVISLASAINISYADIYKCVLPDGQILFQTRCPLNALSANKQTLRAISPIGFAPYTAQTLSVGKQVIINGDFEQGATAWVTMKGSMDIQPKEGIASTNALVLKADGSTDNEHLVRQCLPVQGMTRARIDAFVKKEGGTADTSELRVVSFTSNDCTSGGQYSAKLTPTEISGWQKLSHENIKPTLGAQSIMVEIKHLDKTNSEATSALWDHITLTVTALDNTASNLSAETLNTPPLGVNYLSNPSLDQHLAGWNLAWPGQWVEYGGQSLSGGALITANSNVSHTLQGEALNQCVNIGTHTHFEARAAFKKDALSSQRGYGELRIVWHQEVNCQGLQRVAGSTKSSDSAHWQQLQVSVNNTLKARSATISLTQAILGVGVYAAFWDDISFKATQ
ncbi:hypothetical protein [Marinagarivorans algicola]|uniref:hypothetical protein n=1 Tax=Marinagarivorans algicola TaxID=1513270 RepID=UPI0006B51FFB|nr:hypothetical protein [Marinagarivorans algicola]